MLQNVTTIVRSGLCCGCGTCYSGCINDAISFDYSSKLGMCIPLIDQTKCSNCGICIEVCPGYEVDFSSIENSVFGKTRSNHSIGVFENCYLGYSLDDSIRFSSSSGGIATELLCVSLLKLNIDFAIATDIIVKPQTKEIDVKPILLNNLETLLKAAGSKYAPSPVNILAKHVLAHEGRYILVGLPCHIHGIRKLQSIYPSLKERIVCCIGLFCAKNISLNGTYYLFEQKGVSLKNLQSFKYRGNGFPGGMSLNFLNGSSKFISLNDYYKSDFSAFTITRCLVCCDHSNELADIACGDAWHIVGKDEIGTSVIISRNSRGCTLLEHALLSKRISLKNINESSVIASQGMFQVKKSHIVATFKLWKLLGKRLPRYFGVKFLRPKTLSYFIAISNVFKGILSSKKGLWPILRLVCFITDKLSIITHKYL